MAGGDGVLVPASCTMLPGPLYAVTTYRVPFGAKAMAPLGEAGERCIDAERRRRAARVLDAEELGVLTEAEARVGEEQVAAQRVDGEWTGACQARCHRLDDGPGRGIDLDDVARAHAGAGRAMRRVERSRPCRRPVGSASGRGSRGCSALETAPPPRPQLVEVAVREIAHEHRARALSKAGLLGAGASAPVHAAEEEVLREEAGGEWCQREASAAAVGGAPTHEPPPHP